MESNVTRGVYERFRKILGEIASFQLLHTKDQELGIFNFF